MRIQRTNFLLTVTLKHFGDGMTIDVYDSNFESLPTTRKIGNGTEIIEIFTYMPNKVMLVLSKKTQDNGHTELLGMSLAGININNDILLELAEYKPSVLNYQLIKEYLNNSSTRSRIWNQPGCVIFNLFNPNPFAYHLYIGNKIRF